MTSLQEYLNFIRTLDDVDLEKELRNLIDHGKMHWDGYYAGCDLLQWVVDDWKGEQE